MPEIKLITDNLADQLIPGIERAEGIFILTSFVMKSGVQLLKPYLRHAAERGAQIKLLAGDYLFITQPDALRELCAVDERIEVRLWRSRGASFHPKAYLLDYGAGQGLMIVGSSNLSVTALQLGYEWNLAVDAERHAFTFEQALHQFMNSFYHEQTCAVNIETIRQYEQEYKQHHDRFPELNRLVSEEEESEMMLSMSSNRMRQEWAMEDDSTMRETVVIEPRAAQIEALEALEQLQMEGYRKAMVVMATGLGKTYLAAFWAKGYRRVLFIAHREEILEQAKRSFAYVMPGRSAGLYNGQVKERAASLIFASIYTLSIRKHCELFARDEFDLIVIDEVHHAAASSYLKVLDYFRPKFLLGITATPDRMDQKDVFALCDGNVAYQINFLEAITRNWLSPFQYYGVYDDTDYKQIAWLGTHYDEKELTAAWLREEKAAYVWRKWQQYKQLRTLVFCSSIRQADYLADYFCQMGNRAVSLHSGSKTLGRSESIGALRAGELELIFTVDLFNEGVDIPEVDTLLFVRPTESPTIFIQQIGRGLRLAAGKSHCVIIDLIGNYRNADVKLSWLTGQSSEEHSDKVASITQIPEGCLIELELQVINMLELLYRQKQPVRDRLRAGYMELKREMGRRPTYLELHLFGGVNCNLIVEQFKSYPAFLIWMNEATEEQQAAYLIGEQWLQLMEKTSLTKSYKLVLLLAMLERGPNQWTTPVSLESLAPFFHKYLTTREYRSRAEFSQRTTKRYAGPYVEKDIVDLIKKQPAYYLPSSFQGLIQYQNGQLSIHIGEAASCSDIYRWTQEICHYRLHRYFERKLSK